VKGGTSLTKVSDLIEHKARNLIADIKAAAVDTVTQCDNYTIFF